MDVLGLFSERLFVNNENLVTIEATVATGFEDFAVEECKEKCQPKKVVAPTGRIFFNTAIGDYDKVLALRSVDNLYLVGKVISNLEFSSDKEKALEMVKELVDQVEWNIMLTNWQKLVGFRGNIFEKGCQKSIEEVKPIDPIEQAEVKEAEKEELPISSEYGIGPHGDGISVKNDNLIEGAEAAKELEGSGDNDESVNELTEKMKIEECKPDLDFNNKSELNDVKCQSEIQITEDCSTPVEVDIITKGKEKIQENKRKNDVTETEKKNNRQVNRYKRELRGSKDMKGVEGQMIKYRVTCNRTGKHSFTSMEAARDFGGCLQDKFNWTVNLSDYDLEVVLNITPDKAYISAGLTRGSLHRRNLVHFVRTSLRATLCYGLLRLASPKVGDIILDPMCGGGSVSIEGKGAYPLCYHICGDKEKKALSRTKGNVEALQENQKPEVVGWDVRKLPLLPSSIDVAVTDLPFGKRCGTKSDNRILYKKVLNELGRVVRPNTGRATFLTTEKGSFTQAVNNSRELWKLVRNIKVNQGGLGAYAFLLHRTGVKPL